MTCCEDLCICYTRIFSPSDHSLFLYGCRMGMGRRGRGKGGKLLELCRIDLFVDTSSLHIVHNELNVNSAITRNFSIFFFKD